MSTILTIKAPIKIVTIQLSNILIYPPDTTLIDVNMAIVTKNIIVIAIIQANSIIIKFATSFKNPDILSSPIGSIAIADNLYTNTNIVKMLKSFYKGVKGTFASKKDLKDIAECLFVVNKINNKIVQTIVLNKIKHSKQAIRLAGAVAYVEAIIMNKLGENYNLDINF